LEERVALSTAPAVPAYSSLPGAHATVYLNFSGDSLSSWDGYSNINTPAFDQNGDPTTFTASELNAIHQIWQDVSEDYAPFNINVTTVDPRTVAGSTGGVSQIDIGGNGSWTGAKYGGIAQIGGFSSSSAGNPVRGFAFSANLNNGNPKDTADNVAHESGHTFGLQHQSLWSGSSLTAEYYTGPGDGTAPLMGNSYSAARSLWWYGTSTLSSTTYQNDMDVIAGNTGVGYRPDGLNNTLATASPLTVSGSQLSASGIIGQMADVDYFAFQATPGVMTFTVNDPTPSPNLLLKTELLDAGGTVVASATAGSTFSASLSYTTTTSGTYYLMVAGTGRSSKSTSTNYGFNVGQYAINGSDVPPTYIVNAPTSLSASAKGTINQITLSWTDNASNATGYLVQRSSDGVYWTVLTNSLAATSTTYVDTGLNPAATFYYRVQAFDSVASSLFSNQVKGTTVPLAPTGLAAQATVAGQIRLTWNGVTGATGFQVQRSLNATSWTTIASTGSGVTSYTNISLAASTTYYYRVRAVDAGGGSAYSAQASATTLAQTVLPSAPSGLVATAMLATQVKLTWKDNASNETGFVIERSADGTTWTQIATAGANVTTYWDNSVVAQQTYYYRVCAWDSAGDSPYSNTAKTTTPQGPPDGSLPVLGNPHGGDSKPHLAGDAVAVLFAAEWANHQSSWKSQE
jgi:hypothetical protein